MPEDNNREDRTEGGQSSQASSPVQTRPSAARHRSKSHQTLPKEAKSERSQRSGTVRRRLDDQSTATQDSFTSYETFPSEQGEDSAAQDKNRPNAPQSAESSTNKQSQAQDQLGPLSKTQRPGMVRRASSYIPGPHRGQEFSVHDDPDEHGEALSRRQASSEKSSSGYGTLRSRPSTLRRRQTAQSSTLHRLDSNDDGEATREAHAAAPTDADITPASSGEEGTIQADDDDDDDDDDGLSDAESFTLKDRQEAINETHPFGIRIWKPALYKKSRSVQKTAEGDIHSSPGGRVSRWLWLFNMVWSIVFGWWLAAFAALGALVCFAFGFTPGSVEYGRVLWGLAGYLLYPFGQFVQLEQDEAYAEEDEGEGRSIGEYEQWQSGDIEDGRLFFGPVRNQSLIGRSRSIDTASEADSLLGRAGRRAGGFFTHDGPRAKRRLFGRGEWTFGRVIFFVFFYGLIAPLLLLVSGICWLMVFWIPMGKVTLLLFYHLRRHPLALSFHSDAAYCRQPDSSSSSILLCTYRAVGLKYWKYTIDGTNIFFINLIGVVLFVIFDYWVFDVVLGLDNWLTHPAFIFTLSLFSIIPLAYFIGQAVASISAQSSMGVGAAINAFFSTIVEVFLYCVALNQGKGQLVEGSIIGSIFAGILFLPGLSMCFGAIKRKTQRFNVKSAGVTSTMLLFAVIAAFGPTLFYQIYGSHELNCHACSNPHGDDPTGTDCRRCYFSQVPAVNDRFFVEAVRPYCWFAAVLLFLSYVIGLWFTLRTHAAVIWATEIDEKRIQQTGQGGIDASQMETRHASASGPNGTFTRQQTNVSTRGSNSQNTIRDSQLYKRILGQSLKQVESQSKAGDRVTSISSNPGRGQTPHLVPPKSSGAEHVGPDNSSIRSVQIAGLSEQDNGNLVRQVAEIAATAATVAARDAAKVPRKTSAIAHTQARHSHRSPLTRAGTFHDDHEEAALGEAISAGGGHDAPNWSRVKSAVILMGATVLYAIIAEILVNTVDVVLERVDIDEKFLGITLFALVPNTTEFLNAISFAMNGNIALSMEIGSAYALQVCLLQIPALVLYSAVFGRLIDPQDLIDHTFTLIFPQWDMVTVILCVFLLSYMYGEGKSNYFKGSILVLSYLVVIVGFYFSGLAAGDIMGISRFDTLVSTTPETFQTVGRPRSGRAY
ncbi:MAG: hypothetical protein M1835_007747 [Candelina submexicana]|nr:MAG: hypothetical protein M1835_007747 [Candelina submexicana]